MAQAIILLSPLAQSMHKRAPLPPPRLAPPLGLRATPPARALPRVDISGAPPPSLTQLRLGCEIPSPGFIGNAATLPLLYRPASTTASLFIDSGASCTKLGQDTAPSRPHQIDTSSNTHAAGTKKEGSAYPATPHQHAFRAAVMPSA
jgi:hypothetical protein